MSVYFSELYNLWKHKILEMMAGQSDALQHMNSQL